MEEKIIINDVLSSVKSTLKNFEEAIIESENMELRQTFQNLRNSTESYQYELFKIAESKGYYKPASLVSQDEITQIKNDVLNQ